MESLLTTVEKMSGGKSKTKFCKSFEQLSATAKMYLSTREVGISYHSFPLLSSDGKSFYKLGGEKFIFQVQVNSSQNGK